MAASPATTSAARSKLALVALPVLLVLGATGAWYYTRDTTEPLQYRSARVERGPLQAAISAKGTLNATATVQVGAPIAGAVAEVFVDFNSPVRKDQPLARLDTGALEQRAGQARADLESARVALGAAQAAQSAQVSEVERLTRGAEEAEREAARKKGLADRGFISPAELAKNRAAADSARAQAKAADGQLATAESQLASAQNALRQHEANLKRVLADLERMTVRAPIEGTVVLRNVEAGQTVATGAQAPALFAIAQDLRQMQVEATLGEAEAARLKTGQPATFTVGALPRRTFGGELVRIRKAGGGPDGTAYAVLISAANPDQALLPGMTAAVRIVVESRENALKVPNGALRFRPPGAPAGASQVWTRAADGSLTQVLVRTGITDGTSTEIVEGALKDGDAVIVDAAGSSRE